MDQQQLTEEKLHLTETKARMDREMDEINRRFEENIEAADENSAESIRKLYEERFVQLGKIVRDGTPYFGRIDLLIREEEEVRKLYLGKFALHHEDGSTLVTDWRAPVSNLYYENTVGPVSYRVENRTIEGDLMLKRKLNIKDFKLRGYDDTDIISADEALLPYLAAASDVRLKNIIATIQAEQNAIIRQEIKRHLIVQGMAGSGKTTVALHRVAYLVYLHRNDFHPEHFLILSSGGFFLHYISGILPDLGVENVRQSTFETMCDTFLREKIRVADPLTHLYQEEDDQNHTAFLADGEYKSSLEILTDIDAFITGQYTRVQLAQIRNGKWPEETEKPKMSHLYQKFLKEKGRQVKDRQTEDLAPMMYLCHRLYGRTNSVIRHIVIDEAQDFSACQLKVLRLIFRTATFTILGDLAQGIYPWRGVGDWGRINLDAFDGMAKQMYLQKGYRTTVEIVEAANGILEQINAQAEGADLPMGKAVLRHGDPVERRTAKDADERQQLCREFLSDMAEKSHNNVAMITRRPDLCRQLGEVLNIPALTNRDDQYQGGACVITAALSKGLEFDAVAVVDVDGFSKERGDLHLLYVAMTRPMHVLRLIG